MIVAAGTSGFGAYTPSGALRITPVTGATYTGAYAPDGSLNVVFVSANEFPYGSYHPCGALKVVPTTSRIHPATAPNGAEYVFLESSLSSQAVDTYSPSNGFFFNFLDNSFEVDDPITPANNYRGPLVDPSTGDFFDFFFTRASTGTGMVNGILREFGVNKPRIVDAPGGGKGLLMESARTNLVLFNTDFSNAAWFLASVTKAPTAFTAPDRTQTGCEVATDSTGANRAIGQANIALTAAVHTLTLWVRAGTVSQLQFGLWDQILSSFVACTATKLSGPGSVGAGTANRTLVTGLTSEWTRVQIVTNAAVAANLHTVYVYPGDPAAQIAGDSVGMWGPQLEAGPFGSSQIITAGSSVTRAADSCFILNSAFNLTQGVGTLFVEAEFDGGTGIIPNNRGAAAITDGANAETHLLYNGSGLTAYYCADGGVQQFYQTDLVGSDSVFQRLAGAYGTNDFSYVQNGRAPKTQLTAATLPTTNRIHFGSAAGGALLNGIIKRGAFFGARVADASLQTLTT